MKFFEVFPQKTVGRVAFCLCPSHHDERGTLLVSYKTGTVSCYLCGVRGCLVSDDRPVPMDEGLLVGLEMRERTP